MPDRLPDKSPNSCAVHVRRITDLETKTEQVQERTHRLANDLTTLTMKTDLLDADHTTLKRDYWHGTKDAKAISQKNADTAADIVAAQGKQLLAFAELNSKQESTERVLKWVLAVVTSVGVGTAVVVLSQTLTSGHQ